MKIGAQLYTVHKYCQTLDAFAESLKKVADIGYTTVQVSGTCAYEPEWLAEQLKKNGLACNLTHFDLNRIVSEPDKVVAEHNVFGCKYIGIGGADGARGGGVEGIRKFHEEIGPAVRRLHELGSQFMYHNHNMEYAKAEDGRTYMQLLSDTFTPEEMGFTLDTYWAKKGGAEPVDEVRRLHGRLPCVHYKDMLVMPDGTRRFTWIGNGILNWEEITAAMEVAGTKFIYIEQDDCYGENPFDCLKKSYQYLRSIGLD
jgi:sugar phosphate isomerase/epimerase